jgi:hypothetical protein
MASVELNAEMLELLKAELGKLSPEEKRALGRELGISQRKASEPVVAPDDLSLEDAKDDYVRKSSKAREHERVSRAYRNDARVALTIYAQVAEREGEPLTIVRGRVKDLDDLLESDEDGE